MADSQRMGASIVRKIHEPTDEPELAKFLEHLKGRRSLYHFMEAVEDQFRLCVNCSRPSVLLVYLRPFCKTTGESRASGQRTVVGTTRKG